MKHLQIFGNRQKSLWKKLALSQLVFSNLTTDEPAVPQSVGKPASGAAVQAEIAGQNWARDETAVVFEAV